MTDQNKALTKEVRSRIADALEAAFDKEPDELLALVEQRLHQLESEPEGDERALLEHMLQTTWYFAQSMNVHFKGGDFASAIVDLEKAAQGFSALQQQHPHDLSMAFSAYAQSVVDVRAMNFTQALERMRKVEQHLKGAGTFSNRYRPIVDHLKPEQLYLAAMMSMQQMDYANGRTLLEEAVKAARHVAATYHADGSPLQSIWQGYAHLYRAHFDVQRFVLAIFQFDYDLVISEAVQVSANARAAADLMSPHAHLAEPVRLAAIQSEGFSLLLDALPELARLMKKVFDSTFTPELPGLRTLRDRIHRAGETIAQAGPVSVGLVRYIDQVANQVRNLERLGRPTKKDFGIYSGLVTAVAFMIVFFGTSWANWLFSLGVDSTRLMTTSVLVALIAGFGFGALRFKSLFVPSARKEPE